MIISTAEVRRVLERMLVAEEKVHIDKMITLIMPAVAMCEISFNAPSSASELMRKQIFRILSAALRFERVAEGEPPPQLEVRGVGDTDIEAIGKYMRALVRAGYSVEEIRAWLSRSWDFGAGQHSVSRGEVEGSIFNQLGIIQHFAAILAISPEEYHLDA